ncbi:hypothetical protein C1646_758533 [Rhizophagus diaphanus]|nr:hypothetical protein C1646_758533 [Rhizophagus diaphanus] [Rhizophagus sp. MUCL 43196]
MRVSRSCLNQITFTFLTIALVQVYPNQELTVLHYYQIREFHRRELIVFVLVSSAQFCGNGSVLDEPSSNGDDVENDIDESFLRNKSFGFFSGGVDDGDGDDNDDSDGDNNNDEEEEEEEDY